jgi:heavy metal sensor kinase
MSEAPPGTPKRITRWLRFRLTLSFAVVLAALLGGIGVIFYAVIVSIQNDQITETMDEEWAALRGHLDFQRDAEGRHVAVWRFDRTDPEDELTVARLRRTLLIADAEGQVMELAEGFRSLQTETPEEIRRAVAAGATSMGVRRTDGGNPYIVRTGVMIDGRQRFYVALGRSIARQYELRQRFTLAYFTLVPLLLLAASWIGWLVSKRALQPVSDLARETEAISGSNLKVRIPSRGAGDELDHLIDNFNHMVERLEKSFRQTRQFSTDVSHELRTPLTVIRGQLEVALMTASTEKQYREAIETALSNVERLSGIVRTLLQLSQAESGQMALQKEVFDIAERTRAAAEQFRPLAEANRVSISYRGPERSGIFADPVQIERMLLNLMSNAVKYTESGGAINVSLRELPGSLLEIEVRDTGVGIPKEAQPHIFERLYRVRREGQSGNEGYGLGLSFVKWIIEAHGGTIALESEPGVGSAFRVVLPGLVKQKESKKKAELYGVPGQRTRA